MPLNKRGFYVLSALYDCWNNTHAVQDYLLHIPVNKTIGMNIIGTDWSDKFDNADPD